MCIFCDIINHKIPSRVVYEDDAVLAILDAGPLTCGHTLVMPKKHVDSFLEADAETVAVCFETAHKLAKQIVAKTGAAGANVLTNCGEAAGQSVAHMHIHIIPRYEGDDAIAFNHSEAVCDPDEVLAKIKG